MLLVEAGGAPSFVTGIPALAAHIQLSPYDWQHKTVRQENACLAMHNQAMFAIVVLLLLQDYSLKLFCNPIKVLRPSALIYLEQVEFNLL